MRRAYILSEKNGVVRIGDTVFCVATHQKFRVSGRPSKKFLRRKLVKEKSFEEAKRALLEK